MSDFYVVRKGSTSLSNKVILSGLSYEALGLLLTELTLRPGTPLGYRQMAGRGAGAHRIRKAHLELEAAGFRHRFLVRGVDGSLRTLTVVTDESISSAEAWEEIDVSAGTYLVKIQTDSKPELPKFESPVVEGSGRQIRRSHRAPKIDARCEQEQSRDDEKLIVQSSDQQQGDKSAGRTVRRKTVARSTAARLVVAGRSPNTLWVKESSTLSPQPPKSSTDEPAEPVVGAAMPLGGAPDGTPWKDSSSQYLEASPSNTTMRHSQSAEAKTIPQEAFVSLARQVLPQPMQAMSPAALGQVGKMISQRIEAGWTCEQLTAVLKARELPDRVRTMTGLVKARLRDDAPINAVPPAGITLSSERQESKSSWSHVLPDGRIIRRQDLDGAAIAMDFHRARARGKTTGEDKWTWAISHGIERYLIR